MSQTGLRGETLVVDGHTLLNLNRDLNILSHVPNERRHFKLKVCALAASLKHDAVSVCCTILRFADKYFRL